MPASVRTVLRSVRGVGKVARLEFAAYLPPWSLLPGDDSTVGQLRRLAGPAARSLARGPIGRALFAPVAVLWPLTAVIDALSGSVTHGAAVRRMSGVGRRQQFGEAMVLAHRWNVSPRIYYLFRYWDRAVAPNVHTFLQLHEMAVFELVLTRDFDMEMLGDKEIFGRRCAAAGIPTPPIVAVLETSGAERWSATPGVLPRRDVFAKRAWGKGGHGAERWAYDEATDRWSRRGVELSADDLLAHLRSIARRHRLLIQQCLANHPDIERFSTGSICTFRVMTFIGPEGTPELLGLTFKMPRRDSDVDNFDAGGIASSVDAATGRLGVALSGDTGEAPLVRHPDTLAPIEGSCLTTHRAVIDFALDAHRDLDVPWSVGWDVAITPDGPVMLEGNPMWDIDFFHIQHGIGLPDRFASGLLEQVLPVLHGPPREVVDAPPLARPLEVVDGAQQAFDVDV
jgi:hypothetical protein